MNDRIRALAEQCYEKHELLGTYEFNKEKFAELIVRDCAGICMEMATKCAGLPGEGALAKDCADWIKKDLGVEK